MYYILHFSTFNRIARISSMHYSSAGDYLNFIECVHDNALILRMFTPLELATCSRINSNNDIFATNRSL
jgi:hypothetical protein